MKTLKEIFLDRLQSQSNREKARCCFEKTIKPSLQIWLTQFKENEHICPSKQYYHSNDAQDMQDLGKKNMLLMLLEELTQK